MARHTDTTNRILLFIVAYRETHRGMAPTYEEIRNGVGVSSVSTVAYHIKKLLGSGDVTQEGSYRAILPKEDDHV